MACKRKHSACNWVSREAKDEGKGTYSRIALEPLYPALPVDAAVSDLRAGERNLQDSQEAPVLREDNCFSPGIMLAQPDDVARQRVNLGAK